MAQKTPWHIFYKCFQNQAVKEDLEQLNNWLEADNDNVEMLEEVYNIFSVSNHKTPELRPDTQRAWQTVDQKTSVHKTGSDIFRKRFRYVAAVAAILVFFIMLADIVQNRFQAGVSFGQYSEIVTEAGQKTSVILPDGSKVWLNSSSSLKYPSVFNSRHREVELIGEAFFEVKKNESRKFRVKSKSIDVVVHGTSFNVKNYPDEQTQKITVAEGIVGIVHESDEISRLTIGKQATWNKRSEKLTLTEENPDLVSAWKNNELIFRNTPIKEVVKSLESWYGVSITIDKKMHGEHSYSFRVKTETFREVLDMMKVMTPFNYTINGKDILIKYNN